MNTAAWAIRVIEFHRHKLTRQQFLTLCGQAKAGTPDAALKGLKNLLSRQGKGGGQNGRN